MAGDLGYWKGSISYSPVWSDLPITVSFGARDVNETGWLWQKIEGWDSPDIAGQVVQRASDHGGWLTPQFYAPRVMTLTVTATAPTQALRDVARAQLQQVIPVNDTALLTYNEPVPKQCYIRRSGKIAETYPTLYDVSFSCVITAPDPRKYSADLNTMQAYLLPSQGYGITVPLTLPFSLTAKPVAGSVNAVNAGNFETRPVVTVTGPLTSPRITNVSTGQTVSWTGLVLGTGDQLVVDMDLKQPLLNGALRPADYTSSWWVMNPGQNTIQLGGSQTADGANMTVQWRDAWI